MKIDYDAARKESLYLIRRKYLFGNCLSFQKCTPLLIYFRIKLDEIKQYLYSKDIEFGRSNELQKYFLIQKQNS